MDIKSALGFLQKALPWIGAAASGNVPALIALAADSVGGALGHPVEATPEAIATSVAGATPDQLIKLREAENDFKLKAQALGFQHEEELRRLELQEAQVFAGDTQSARSSFSKDRGVFAIGCIVLAIFGLVIIGVLWGCYELVTGGMQVSDPGTIAAIFGFVGTVVGYVAANAQQVISFFFGSSKGSAQHSDVIADTVKDLAARVHQTPA